MLFLSYLLFGLTAHAIIRDRVLAVIATLALITFPHISYEAQRDLSHTVALLFAACMFVFFFVRALQRPTVVNYAMAGVSIGIGILSKYNFVLLAVSRRIALLPDRQLRRRLFDWRTLLMVAVGGCHRHPARSVVSRSCRHGDGRDHPEADRRQDGSWLAQIGEGLLSLALAVVTFILPTLRHFRNRLRPDLTAFVAGAEPVDLADRAPLR